MTAVYAPLGCLPSKRAMGMEDIVLEETIIDVL